MVPFFCDCNVRKKTQIENYLLHGIQFSGVVDFDSLYNTLYYTIKSQLGKRKWIENWKLEWFSYSDLVFEFLFQIAYNRKIVVQRKKVA